MTEESIVPLRRAIDDIEIGYLCGITTVAIALNTVLLSQLITGSRQPTVRTSFSTGPYQLSSFSMFKINLCISDFGILLIYALGKICWLITYDWRLGDFGCKTYQFFSALSFYANSNIVVAIGLDRLKVVYTRHLQGATSVRRVRLMITFSWFLATVCSIPQIFVWKTVEVSPDWHQCVSIFSYHKYMNTSTPLLDEVALIYEMSHQATVFWIPFTVILASYVMIVMKIVVYHTLRTKVVVKGGRSSDTDHRPDIRSAPDSLMVPKTVSRKWSQLSIFSAVSSEIHTKPRKGIDRHRSGSLPAWRRQLRSRVFRSALAVVLAHIAMWLPYNCISTLRFINFDAYSSAMSNGGNFLEDLIVVNSLLNPLLYGHRTRPRRN